MDRGALIDVRQGEAPVEGVMVVAVGCRDRALAVVRTHGWLILTIGAALAGLAGRTPVPPVGRPARAAGGIGLVFAYGALRLALLSRALLVAPAPYLRALDARRSKETP